MSNLIVRPGGIPTNYQEPTEDRSTGSLVTCVIGQPTTQTPGMEIGKFNFSDPAWKPSDTLKDVALFLNHKTRVLYGKEMKKNAPVRCRSESFKEPAVEITNPVSHNCFDCPLSQWGDKLSDQAREFKTQMEKELGVTHADKPLCKEVHNLFVVDSRLTVFVLPVSKGQLSNARNNLYNVLENRFGTSPCHHVLFDVTLNKTGAFYGFRFENFRVAKDTAPYDELFGAISSSYARRLADLHNEVEQEKVQEVGPNEIKDWEKDEIPF